MPGLVSILLKNESLCHLGNSISRMMELLCHDISYGKSVGKDERFAVGAIDLDKGDFVSRVIESESYILGFTGQVYDQEILAERISNEGKQYNLLHLILALYERFGLEGITGLNGLYVIVIWDKKAKRLHIVNDRYGFRKLYYWNGSDKLVFASEYKAICWFPDFQKKVDLFAFANIMTFGYVLEDRTLFEEIKLLPPASIATIEEGNLTIKKYWDYSFYEEGDARLSEDEYIDGFAEKLKDAVKKRLKGVDKLALPLSGGLDSRTIAAVLCKLGTSCHVMAYSYGHRHCHDVRFGRKIAKKLGFMHEIIGIEPNFIQKNARVYQYVSEGMRPLDWSWRIDSRNNFALRKRISFVLSGFLGDVLCGSDMAWKFLSMVKNDETAFEKVYKSHVDSFIEEELLQYLNFNIYERIQGYNYEVLHETYNRAPTCDIYNKARYINLHQRQRRNTSLLLDQNDLFASSLSPFTDNAFVDFILHVPVELQRKQSLYKKMLIRHFPEVVRIGISGSGFPIQMFWWQEALQWRMEKYKPLLKKFSFGYYGSHNYADYRHSEKALRTSSRQFMLDAFKSNVELKKNFLNGKRFDNLVSEFLAGKIKNYEKVCYPLTFFIWADIFLSDTHEFNVPLRKCLFSMTG